MTATRAERPATLGKQRVYVEEPVAPATAPAVDDAHTWVSPLEILRIAWEGVVRNKARSLLTMLGVIIGVAAVIIMIAIPFGLIGAILGHLVMGLEFTMISIFGIVALSGIVVNDSLILIDFINRAASDGVEIHTAVIESGRARFRPVMLTSLTTIAGLFPLLLERSFQAQFLVPMAVSISFGLLAATVLTLLFVPSLYLVVYEVNQAWRRSRGAYEAGAVGSNQ